MPLAQECSRAPRCLEVIHVVIQSLYILYIVYIYIYCLYIYVHVMYTPTQEFTRAPLPLTPGAAQLVATLHARGAKVELCEPR